MSPSEVERQLLEYRAMRERQQLINRIKTRIKSLIPKFKSNKNVSEVKAITKTNRAVESSTVSTEPLLLNESDSIDKSNELNRNSSTYYNLLFNFLCFILWIIAYAIFVEFQFGIVFLIISGIVFMFINTRTGPKQPNEISAYSVFNKNCESIDGTLKAEQFEKEIRYGSGIVR